MIDMHTQPMPEYDPCLPLLAGVALSAFVGLIVWIVKRPKAVVGRRRGQIIYGLSLEWPAAFGTAIILVIAHASLASHSSYLQMLSENREPLGDAGIYLLLTIGALAFSKVREQRNLKILCLVLASLGLCMACAFKLAC